MDRQEYLNQISAVNRPTKGSKGGIFSSKFFWVGAIGLAVLVLIIIMGMALGGGNSSSPKEKLYALLTHINNTSAVINEYQTNIKSSSLRADSISLASVLSDTSGKLDNYVNTKYKVKDKDLPKKMVNDENAAKEELSNELFEAKINGILDRTYAHKMIYEISLIISREEQILKNSKDNEIIEILTQSHSSLEVLYNKFNEFTEGK